jgi:DNA-binding IclR family transcriptional regulator
VIQSVDRAIRVLTALQGARRMTLSELATRLELPPSTVHGIVKTLVGHGMVTQERGSSRYQLGPAVLLLGNVYLDTLELRSKAIPWAEDLARRTGAAVRTGVLLLDEVVIIHHEPRPDGSRQMPEVGIVIPAHASALGKAILVFDQDAADRVLSTPVLRSMTGETITSPQELRDQLAEIEDVGIATEQDAPAMPCVMPRERSHANSVHPPGPRGALSERHSPTLVTPEARRTCATAASIVVPVLSTSNAAKS